VYSFAYTVTVTNTGDVPSQLISRHWVIEDGKGQVEEVKGLGAVGHQPLLQPGQSFQYTSGCRLKTPSGMMHGSYFFVAKTASALTPRSLPLCWPVAAALCCTEPQRAPAVCMRDLNDLLQGLDPQAPLAERHLWLIHTLGWVRGDGVSPQGAIQRLKLLIDAVDARPELAGRLQAWWGRAVPGCGRDCVAGRLRVCAPPFVHQ
jgi:hypothetical protein